MTKTVREPIQVYLTTVERADLDRAAGELGVSRSEALRQGIQALNERRYAGELSELMKKGLVTPAISGPDGPPPSLPAASLDDVLADLSGDREDR